MAKVKFSALITEMRNKLNGSVFSKNRAGNYLRNKTSPAQPRTPQQMANRQTFGFISQAWRGLTQAQRNAWIGASGDYPRTDVFGDVKFPSGQQLFMEVNRNILLVGSNIILTPPERVTMPEIFAVEIVEDEGTLLVNWDTNATDTNNRIVIEMTPPVSPGRQYLETEYRIVAIQPATLTGFDMTAIYTDRFGAPVVGQKIGARVYVVNQITGQATVRLNTEYIWLGT